MAFALAGPMPGRASNSEEEAVLMLTAASDSEAARTESAAKRNFFIRAFSYHFVNMDGNAWNALPLYILLSYTLHHFKSNNFKYFQLYYLSMY